MIRESPIAGTWYAGSENELRNQLEQLFLNKKFGPGALPIAGSNKNQSLEGIIVPHAGYKYSGYTAAHAYKLLAETKPDLELAIILGPNHSGIGPDISVSDASGWETPLGTNEVNQKVVDRIQQDNNREGIVLEIEDIAHLREHSIEIQLPFLQYLYGSDLQILPICLKDQTYPTSKRLGSYLVDLLDSVEIENYTIIASTDLSHEYSVTKVEENDEIIIDAIKSGKIEEFDKKRDQTKITMCGYGTVYSLMEYCRATGKDKPLKVNTLNYTNSAKVTGSSQKYTVGYFAGAMY